MGRLSESGGFRDVARAYAVALRELRNGGNADGALQSCRQWMEGETDYIWELQNGDTPKWLAVWSRDEMVVLIDGLTTRAQADHIHSAYNASITGPYEFPVNQVYQDCANRIGDLINQHRQPANRTTSIAGYSMGGCIAQLLLKDKISYPWIGMNPQVLTFGSPRVSNRNVCADIRAAGPVFRWFFKNDPVPYIPFHPDESLAFAVYAGRFNSVNYGRFVHPIEGIEVGNVPTNVYRMLPSAVPPISCTNLAAWWMQWMTGTIYAHNLEVFIAEIPPNPGVVVRPTTRPQGPVEVVQGHTTRQANAAERQVANGIVTLERQATAVPLAIPPQRVVTAQRIGRIWGVYFGDTLIAVRPGRRTARHIARSFNEVLERLQTSAVVEPEALLATFRSYLEAATDPAGGFTPVMNTQMPQ